MSKTKLWYLSQFNFIERLTSQEVKWLLDNMQQRMLKRKEAIVFDATEPYIYFLKTGHIKIATITDDGDEDIKYLVKPGQLFGELAIAGGESPDDMAVALQDTLVCWVHRNIFLELSEKNRGLNNEITQILGERIRKVERKLMSMVFKDAKTRIVEFIEDFAKEFGNKEEGEWKVKNFLTHAEIAKLTATSRQTVATVMNKMRKRGAITYDDQEICLHKKVFK